MLLDWVRVGGSPAPSLTHPCLPYALQSKAHGVQKKAYRVLEEVCASPQGPGARFVQSHLDDLKKTLLDSLRSTSSPAKRVRTPGTPRGGLCPRGDEQHQERTSVQTLSDFRGGGGTEGPDCCPPVPQPRLKCLIHIVRKLSAEHEEFISALVPEVRGAGGECVVIWGSLEWGS